MDNDFKGEIAREQVRLVFRQLPTMQIASFIVGLVLAYTVWNVVSRADILVWLIMLLVIVAGRIVLYYRFLKVQEEPFNADYWRKAYLLLAFVSGVVWGLSAFTIFPSRNPELISLFALAIASLSAATTVSHSSLRLGPAVWAGPTMLCYAGRCFMEGGKFGHALGFLIIVYFVAILRHSFHHHSIITASISLKFENMRLLREVAELKYRTLFEQSPDGIVLMDTEGHILDFNKAAHLQLGYSREEFAGLRITDIVAAESEEDIQKRLEEILRNGKYEHEVQHTTKQGEMRDVNVNSQTLVLSGQTILHTIWRDITESKRVEQALRESEARFSAVFRASPVGISISRIADGRVVDANDAFLNIFGLEREEVIGRTSNELRLWADPEERDRMVNILREKGRIEDFEVKFRRESGEGGDLLISAEPIELAGEQYWLGLLSDITKRKRVEEALRQREEFIRSVLDNVDEGFLVIDRDYRIIIANKAFCSWGATQLDDLIGRRCHEVSHKTLRPCYEEGEDCAVRRIFETGEPHTALHKHQDAGGEIMYVETRAFPLKDSSGVITSVIETVHNITERHLLEEERLKTQKLEAIGTLAGGIAHDFNNLLQGVFAYISLAKISLDHKGKAFARLEQAEKALNMSVNLATQLLTFSRGGKPVRKRIALGAVIENAANFALSGSRSVSRLDIAKDLWYVEADEGQVGQVIQNIVLNANEAMPDGGTVAITAANVDIPAAGNPLLPDGGKFVRLAIGDSGVGIPKEYLSKIFDPYFTTKQKGSGLGLATSYSIVRNHGGLLEVTSELNKGSTFFIYLPASGAEEGENPRPLAPLVARRGKILVMDDEEIIRGAAEELIGSLGHEVESAEDGEDAIKKFMQARESGRPFDVVILDLTVRGGMGGDQTIKKLRELDPNIKAIVSSGYADNEVVSDCRSYGFMAYLSKPYTIDALADSLNTLMG